VSRDRLLAAVGEVYQCATRGAEWPTYLTSVGSLLEATSTNLLYHDHRSLGGINVAVGADPELYRKYAEFGHVIDPWALACRPNVFPPASVVAGASLIEHSRFVKTEFYAAMGRRFDTTRGLFGVLEASRYQTAVLSVNRGDRGEEFDADEARTMAILVPHVRRALAIQQKLSVLEGERSQLVDAADRMRFGVVLIDNRGRPIFINRNAARLIEARDGLAIARHSLVATDSAVDTRLQLALRSAVAVNRGEAVVIENGELLIPRAEGRRPLHACVSPAGSRDFYGGRAARTAALLLLSDPEERTRPSVDRLRDLFSLTAAEARVAEGLAAGQRAADIADSLGVSRETVRSQIKRVLEKADARSQSAFIRLVATAAVRMVRHHRDE